MADVIKPQKQRSSMDDGKLTTRQAVVQFAQACVVSLENLDGAAEPHALPLAALLERACSSGDRDKGSMTAARELVWERLHSGRYFDLPIGFREAYGAIELLAAEEAAASNRQPRALNALDMCLLMGGPHSRKLAGRLVSAVEASGHCGRSAQESSAAPVDGESRGRKRPRSVRSMPMEKPAAGRLSCPGRPRKAIMRVEAPSLSEFLEQHMNTRVPVILTGAMEHWPALGPGERAWSDLDYLRRVAGQRLVPVEIGKNYLSEEWSQQLLSFGDFLDRFVLGKGRTSGTTEIGYLAQHQLFEQVAALRRDIFIPDYCALARDDEVGGDDGVDEGVTLNAWFGPGGTVSPLHFDLRHNLLAQVVGRKYICLFSPEFSQHLYPDNCGLMPNNSRVNFEYPDLEQHPLFAEAPGLECELRAGEMLYIPPRFWHFVRSECTSFSVSFWWGKRWKDAVEA